MNERTPQPYLRLMPPSAENGAGPTAPDIQPVRRETPLEPPVGRERLPLPDYSQATDKELTRAQIREELRLLRADLGHLFLKVMVMTYQLYNIVYRRGDTFEIFPGVTGMRPDLDENERVATERIQALSDEKRLRRSIRQQLHDR